MKKSIFFFSFLIIFFLLLTALGSIFKNKEPISQNRSGVTVLSENLEIPWSIAFLPEGNMLVTERPGGIKLIDKNGRQTSISQFHDDVEHYGDTGLMGLVLHPDFVNNRFVYIYYTHSSNEEKDLNRIIRFKFDGENLIEDKVILDVIPAGDSHDGGRMKFGSDGFLYVTTGDARNESLAQDISSLAGKILRMTDEGEPVPGNHFNNLVYSYGHRNPQGLAWDQDGRLWATEHGPKGFDELNLIEPGNNYGWPVITGDEKQEGMTQPVIHSGTDTWAPAGAVYVNGSIFFGGLISEALYQVLIEEEPVRLIQHFKNEFGRIRDVVAGPEGMLYISTSNRDLKGEPINSDDRII